EAGRGAGSAPGPRSTHALELWRPPEAAGACGTCGGRRAGTPSRLHAVGSLGGQAACCSCACAGPAVVGLAARAAGDLVDPHRGLRELVAGEVARRELDEFLVRRTRVGPQLYDSGQ